MLIIGMNCEENRYIGKAVDSQYEQEYNVNNIDMWEKEDATWIRLLMHFN